MYRSIILFVITLISGWSVLTAQNQTDRFEQIKAHKVAYLTEKMDLTVDEAEKFWPIYNDYEKKLDAIRKEARLVIKNSNDEEARDILFATLEKEEQEINLKREFYETASRVLSYRKLYLMVKGEREFRIKLLDRYKNMRNRR